MKSAIYTYTRRKHSNFHSSQLLFQRKALVRSQNSNKSKCLKKASD